MMSVLFTLMMFITIKSAVSLTFEPTLTDLEQQKELQPFVVIGGSVVEEDVIKGTVLNEVYLNIKSTIATSGKCAKTGGVGDYAHRLDVYWENELFQKAEIKKFYTVTERTVDSIFKYTVSGLDTATIPETTNWNNKNIRVGATHYACVSGQWILDDNYYGARRTTNDDFVLIDKTNNCERKSLGVVCYDSNTVAEKYQTVYTDSSGNCGSDYTITEHCSDRCENGECVSSLKVGDKKCSVGNVYVMTWDGSTWNLDLCEQEGVGYCKEGVCNKPPITDPEDPEDPPIDPSCLCEEGDVTIAKCKDGSDVVVQRCSDCAMVDVPASEIKCETTPEDPIYVPKNPKCTAYQSINVGVCKTDLNKLMTTDGLSAYVEDHVIAVFGIVALMFSIIITAILVMRRRG